MSEHRVEVERVDDPEGYGFGWEAHCRECDWTTGGGHTLRQIEDLAADHATGASR